MNFMDWIEYTSNWFWQLVSGKLIEKFYDLWSQNIADSIILVRNVTSVWSICFVGTKVFCATQKFFVEHVQNVSLKNIVNKEKQIVAINNIWKGHDVLHLLARYSALE